MDYRVHRPSAPAPAAHLTAAPPQYYPHAASYLSDPNPISAAASSTAANPYPSPAANSAAYLTAAPPQYYSHAASYISAPNPISAAVAAASTAANPYPSPAANSAAAYAPYGGYAAADPGIGRATIETPYYYTNVGGTGGQSLPLNEGDAPSKDPGLDQAYYYNGVGGGHGTRYGHVLPAREGGETFMDPGKGHASSSYYYSQVGGSGSGGGGYGNGLSVAPYSDVGLGQTPAALRYQYNSAAGVGVGGGGGGGYVRGLVAKEAIRQYGIDPHAQQTQTWPSTGLEPRLRSNGTANNMHSREQQPMRVNKVSQPVRCEVCKIMCNNKEVLMIHKRGKKHKKNMLKLQEAITAKPTRAQVTVADKKDEGSSVANKDKVVGEQKKRAAPATVEDLQIKKKRILEGGAAASEIKICTICNVVVNSQQVLDYHLAGQKHAAMVKQQAS